MAGLLARALSCGQVGRQPALTDLPSLARQAHGKAWSDGSGNLDLVRSFQAREAGMIAADLGRTACDDPGERIRP